MKMLVTVTYAENEWVRNLELGRLPPSSIPADRPLLRMSAAGVETW